MKKLRTKSITEAPDSRSVYFWNIMGSLSNAMMSVLVLMVVTRFLDNKQTDIFSIAWSISQLMMTIGTFQIRVYQATDVKGVFRFRQYLVFRIVTIMFMLLSSAAYIWVRGYDIYKGQIILIVCLFRAVDALSDVYEGWFQQKERLDLSGKSLTYRVVMAMIGFTLTLWQSQNLLAACLVLLSVYIVCFVLYDLRYIRSVEILKDYPAEKTDKRWFLRLFMEGLPLFVNSYIMMDIINTPKMVIDTGIMEGTMSQGSQTIFNILFMPASVLTLAYIVFRPMITRMAIVWQTKKIKQFLTILARIGLYLVGIGVVLLSGAALLGIPVLSWLYVTDLSNYTKELLVLMVGGCAYTFAAILDNALVIVRKQYYLIIAYVVSWIYIKLVVNSLVMQGEIMGAATAYMTTMFVFLFITGAIFSVSIYRKICESKKR